MSQDIRDFKGVIPAVLSVFDKDENLDEQGTRELIRHLLSYDIGGLYITGSTGETFLMDSEERKRQVEIVMEEVGDKVPVVVHVGAMSTRATIELAKHAEKWGAAGVSSVPPFYFKYNGEQIYQYYKDVAEATSLPMIVYNIPLAGMMTVDQIIRLSEIDNVKGVKYTGTALYEVMQIRDGCKEGFQIYGGCDELGSSNISLGVDGIIGSFYNVIPDLEGREGFRHSPCHGAAAQGRPCDLCRYPERQHDGLHEGLAPLRRCPRRMGPPSLLQLHRSGRKGADSQAGGH